MSVTKTPWISEPILQVLFVKILSIKVAELAVTLMGRVIKGKSMLLYIKSKKISSRTVDIRIQ